MKPIHRSDAAETARRKQGAAYARLARKALPAAIALAFAHATWADPITINPGGNASSLPVNGATSSTSVTNSIVTPTSLSMTISGRAVIDWSSFNIGSGNTVNFTGTGGAVLNRVPLSNSSNRSNIDGALNGQGLMVMLMNPNGVLFGSTAAVNVGALVATTGTIDETEFMTRGKALISGATGQITNSGYINATGLTVGDGLAAVHYNGLAALVAPSVVNQGTIIATGGTIALAGTTAATITMNGGLYEFAVSGPGTEVTNAAGASLNGANIYLSTGDAANVLSGTINLNGIQQATSLIVVDGDKVVLTTDLKAPLVSGHSNKVEVHGAGAAPLNAPQIQDAVDIAKAGAAIDVWSGTYTEGHANVDYFGAPGGGQLFGLHVYKDNLVIKGFNASGGALLGLDDSAMPVVTAQYQTGFGAQHFISGSGVTIDGLKFKPVATGDNKTFEVIGNDFTLRNSVIDNTGNATSAAFYISDFSVPGDPFALLGRPAVQTFHIQNNRFIAGNTPGALVVVASGTGNSTAASNRVFSGNELIGKPGLTGARGFQIQGQLPHVPWQKLTAGAVTVENNKFSNFSTPVRTVGTLTQELDWNSVFNNNTFMGGAALAFAGNGTTARAATVSVIPQDGTTTPNDAPDTRITRDIQTSIDRAQAGDTVRARAGTYTESLTIGKALTLDGAGKGSTIISSTSSGADGIVVQGNIGAGATVAITDLTVQGGNNGIRVADGTTLGTITLDGLVVRDNASNGFISNNGGSSPTTVSNINIRNSVFKGNGFGGGSADINLFLFNGRASLKNVDILGTRGPDVNSATDYGLQIRGQGDLATMTAAGHVTLDDVRIAGNYRRAHLGIQRYSDASNIVMNNVVLGGARSGVSLGDSVASVASSNAGWGTFFSSDMHGAASLGNTRFAGGAFGFGDIFIGGDTGGLRVDATQAEFSGITRTHTAAGAENFGIEDRVTHALDNASIGGLVTWQASNLYVTQSSGSIQRGINAACACDTVRVGAGTFAEQLTITKSLSLLGAGSASTTIAPTVLAADSAGTRNILTIGGGPATNAEVSGFTLKGPVPQIDTGIFVRDGAHARIHDNKIVDIRDSALLTGNQQGVGILVGRASLSTSGTAVIENNEIRGYQKGGIVVDGPGSQAAVTGNTVAGAGPTGVIAQNGIQVSRGAIATVSGNDVRGNVYTGHRADADDFASGIMFFTSNAYLGQGGITIGSTNTVTANEFGIWTNDSRTLSSTSLSGVSGNTRNAVAYFNGGYQNEAASLKYPAWSAASAALVNATTFGGAQPGDIVDVGGALRVSGWSGFSAIQPAVNAVASGGAVNVSAGNYAENVVVDGLRNLTFGGSTLHSLTLTSAAAGSGIGGSVTADGAAGFSFNGPVVLLSDTALSTAGANIAFNGDIQSAGASSFGLTLRAGSGDVTLVSGGTAGKLLGALDVTSNDFTLTGTLWLTGFSLNAGRNIALSDHSLHDPEPGIPNPIHAGGRVDGTVVTESKLFVEAGGEVHMNIDAPSGSTVRAGGETKVNNIGDSVIEVNGRPQAPASLSASADTSRMVPTEATLSGNTGASSGNAQDSPSADEAKSARGRTVRSAPARASLLLDKGLSVEIDLTPSNDSK